MKLVADENVTRELVDELVARGHDVLWIAQATPGLQDEEIFRLATREGRVILTHDKGHGRRALKQPVPGVILVRATETQPVLAADVLVDVLENRSDWTGNLAVIHGRRVRTRALPDLSS